MVKQGWKYKFMGWYVHDYCKTPLGQIIPKSAQILHAIFWPIDFFCWKQETLKYDYARSAVWIDGKMYDRRMFAQFMKVGSKFEVISTEDDMITLKEIE